MSLSLDAWTSPNQYAFLAIVAHFVTNDGCLGTSSFSYSLRPSQVATTDELLIDFTELIGEHTGANMADAVWSTMKRYGLVGRVSDPIYGLGILTNQILFRLLLS